VLNTRDYLTVPEKQARGSHKDFFEGRDRDFVEHKASLQRQVVSISAAFKRSNVGHGFVKVVMRREAWAKSHRPNERLFPHESVQCVGAAKIGELYYQVDTGGLQNLEKEISKAEDNTRWKEDEQTGKTVSNPSIQRSEVGAIEAIALPIGSDKRSFGAEEALHWFLDPRTGGLYLVELFAPSFEQALRNRAEEYVNSVISSVQTTAKAIGLRTEVIKIPLKDGGTAAPFRVIGIRLLSSTENKSRFSTLVSEHQRLLRLLDDQVAVRRIMLPPIISPSRSTSALQGQRKLVTLPEKKAGVSYPKVAVVDGGLSDYFGPWIIGRNDLLAKEHRSTDHGGFIAGLLVCGQQLNGSSIAPEQDGCELYDLALLPDENIAGAFEQYYPNTVVDFMFELESAVEEAKKQHGIRIFNLSINLEEHPVAEEAYGYVAELLDRIADRHDVLFVISCGNLNSRQHRPIWPADPKAALQMLAARNSPDTLLQPSESARSLTVGSLNPPNLKPYVAGAPACYSRRGPGLKVGVKPDLAHFGGAASKGSHGSGLISTASTGEAVTDYGTSYATPLVGKSVASLDNDLGCLMTHESLIGLTIHNAKIPQALQHKTLQDIARQFVGFGFPSATRDVLVTPDNAITLVFTDTLQIGHQLQFDFAWPKCLVTPESACKGSVKMTLVYRPTLDGRFGSEFVRINVDARLKQERDGTFKSQLKQAFLPESKDGNTESDLIKHGLKWWPIKIYQGRFPKGIGESSNWRLTVDSLTRSQQVFPKNGVPFAVILSVSSLDASKPVFADMRLYLRSRNVRISDIRAISQVRTRA
jgi:hypothetical protein